MATDLITKEQVESLAEFQDPFRNERVQKIDIEAYPNTNLFNTDSSGNRHRVKASIRFVAGSTIGYHNVFGDDIISVAVKVQAFLKTLG